MNQDKIKDFWERFPCGNLQVGGIEKYGRSFEEFFTAYDRFRYRTESHIPECLDAIDFKNKQTLEIGLGQGAESEQIIRRGAIWSGVDLTTESVNRVRMRLTLRKLPFGELKVGSVLELPFEENSFDIVFSHGVMHHVPDIKSAQRQIWRVLKSEGELIIMLYAKHSLNYWLSIALLRRLGLVVLYLTGYRPGGIYNQHLAALRKQGLTKYLKMSRFIHRNTDGPLNPYSKVYKMATVRKDFIDFKVTKAYKRFMHAPPIPVGWLPLESLLGWHLWVHMKPSHKLD